MHCPACDANNTRVLDSRVAEGGASIRRRRECESCHHRFSTVEHVELLRMMVVKKDGRREPYTREKLESGVRAALEKRPIPEARVRELLATIERKIQAKELDEVPTAIIGSFVMRGLKQLDDVAYIRFASVYKSFRDADTFRTELKRLQGKKTKKRKHLTK
jgi:transcriptional repressor NrdR